MALFYWSHETLMLILLNCLALFGLLFVLILLVRLALWCLRCNVQYRKKTNQNRIQHEIDETEEDDEEKRIGGASIRADSGVTTASEDSTIQKQTIVEELKKNQEDEVTGHKNNQIINTAELIVDVEPPKESDYVEINMDSLVTRNAETTTVEIPTIDTKQEFNTETLENSKLKKGQLTGTNTSNPYATLTFPRIAPKSRPANGQCYCDFCSNNNKSMGQNRLAPIQCLNTFGSDQTSKQQQSIVVTIEQDQQQENLEIKMMDQLDTKEALEKLDQAIEEMEQFNRLSLATVESEVTELPESHNSSAKPTESESEQPESSSLSPPPPELPPKPKPTETPDSKPEIPLHSYPKFIKKLVMKKSKAPKVPEPDYPTELAEEGEETKPEIPKRSNNSESVAPRIGEKPIHMIFYEKPKSENNEIDKALEILNSFSSELPKESANQEASIPESPPEIPEPDYSDSANDVESKPNQNSVTDTAEIPPEIPETDSTEIPDSSLEKSPETPPEVPVPDYLKEESMQQVSEIEYSDVEPAPEIPEPNYPKEESKESNDSDATKPTLESKSESDSSSENSSETPPEVPEPDYPKDEFKETKDSDVSKPTSESKLESLDVESVPEVPRPEYPKEESNESKDSGVSKPTPESKSELDSLSENSSETTPEVPEPDYPKEESVQQIPELKSLDKEPVPEVSEPDYLKEESKESNDSDESKQITESKSESDFSSENSSETPPEVPEPDYPKEESKETKDSDKSKLESSNVEPVPDVPERDYPKDESKETKDSDSTKPIPESKSKSDSSSENSSETPPEVPEPDYPKDESIQQIPELKYLDEKSVPEVLKPDYPKAEFEFNDSKPTPESLPKSDSTKPVETVVSETNSPKTDSNNNLETVEPKKPQINGKLPQNVESNVNHIVNIPYKRPRNYLFQPVRMRQSDRIKSILEQLKLNIPELQKRHSDSLQQMEEMEQQNDQQEEEENDEFVDKEIYQNPPQENEEIEGDTDNLANRKPEIKPKKIQLGESTNPQLSIYSQVVDQIKQRTQINTVE